MDFGAKVKDTFGYVLKLLPKMASTVSTGQVTMSDSLVDTDNYYASVDLPGTSAITGENVTAMLNAFRFNANLNANRVEFQTTIDSTTYYGFHYMFYATSAKTHYTRSWSTGTMTSWTAGDGGSDNLDNWDGIRAIFPVVFWRKLTDDSFTDVKMFSAMCYDVFDGSAENQIKAYQVGADGVEKTDFAILMKNRQVE